MVHDEIEMVVESAMPADQNVSAVPFDGAVIFWNEQSFTWKCVLVEFAVSSAIAPDTTAFDPMFENKELPTTSVVLSMVPSKSIPAQGAVAQSQWRSEICMDRFLVVTYDTKARPPKLTADDAFAMLIVLAVMTAS